MPASSPSRAPETTAPAHPTWSFLTNQPVILIYVVQNPDSTVRVIAQGVGLTERAALGILRDLDDEGLVTRHREGRRNTYVVNYSRLLGVAEIGSGMPNGAMVAVVRALTAISPEAQRAAKEHAVTAHDRRARAGTWEFFTNHMTLLGAIARNPTGTVRELAISVGITERSTVAILNQLEASGVVERLREGRRNSYTIDLEAFRGFGGWQFEGWRIPDELIDVATNGIKLLLATSG